MMEDLIEQIKQLEWKLEAMPEQVRHYQQVLSEAEAIKNDWAKVMSDWACLSEEQTE